MIEISAQVASVLSASEIAINVGTARGVQIGDSAIVWRSVDIRDPNTNESLGSVLRRRLQLDVRSVEERFCVASVHIPAPNVLGSFFGRQTTWITGMEVKDEALVPLKSGDQVTVYSTADDEVEGEEGEEGEEDNIDDDQSKADRES